MAKLKLTKNELKRQKELLKRFNRYLPTLKLKKQQLQMEISRIQQQIESLTHQISMLKKKVYEWVDVFAQPISFEKIFSAGRIVTETGNIAGIDIPVFSSVVFEEHEYDLMDTPLWVDAGVKALKEMTQLHARLSVVFQQQKILQEELRITVQRVNLFEKVKIPQTRENIRLIRITLGDLQTAAVVRGKIAKTKIDRKREMVPA